MQESVEYYKTGFEGIDNSKIKIKRGDCLFLTGYSGSYKSTLAMQIAYNIAKEYQHSVINHIDLSGNKSVEYFKNITKCGDSFATSRYLLIHDSEITWDDFYNMINLLATRKPIANADQPTILIANSIQVFKGRVYSAYDRIHKKMIEKNIILILTADIVTQIRFKDTYDESDYDYEAAISYYYDGEIHFNPAFIRNISTSLLVTYKKTTLMNCIVVEDIYYSNKAVLMIKHDGILESLKGGYKFSADKFLNDMDKASKIK